MFHRRILLHRVIPLEVLFPVMVLHGCVQHFLGCERHVLLGGGVRALHPFGGLLNEIIVHSINWLFCCVVHIFGAFICYWV